MVCRLSDADVIERVLYREFGSYVSEKSLQTIATIFARQALTEKEISENVAKVDFKSVVEAPYPAETSRAIAGAVSAVLVRCTAASAAAERPFGGSEKPFLPFGRFGNEGVEN